MRDYVEKTMLVPEYINEFQCIGPQCEDHCCQGWLITVDRKSFFSLKEIKNSELTLKIKESVVRNRKRGQQTEHALYAKIRLNQKNSCCNLLMEDRLCLIHKELGEDHLPNTCYIYPRYTKYLFGIYQQSLSFSCPEAARRGLLKKGSMQFLEKKIRVRSELIETRTLSDSQDIALANEIRFFCINLLQYRAIPLWQRLVILGYFCEQGDKLKTEQKGLQTGKLIESVTNSLATSEWEDLFKVISPDIEKQIHTSFCLMLIKLDSSAEYYKKIISLTFDGLNTSQERLLARYYAALELGASQFCQEHEYIMENFLVNEVFTTGFPLLTTNKTWFDNWIWLAGIYKILHCSWVGLFASLGEKMDTDTAITATQAFAKAFNHANDAFKDHAVTYLKEEGMKDFASSLSLLKPE